MKSKLFLLVAVALAATLSLSSCTKETKLAPVNYQPRVDSVIANVHVTLVGGRVTLSCLASDDQHDTLNYNWYCPTGGTFPLGHDSASTTWRAPTTPIDSAVYAVFVTASNRHDSAFGGTLITVFNGDKWNDTGEPFIDLPDSNGHYNGVWDPGEYWYDLPSAYVSPSQRAQVPSTNGVYDGPNSGFDESELFTFPAPSGHDPGYPILYTFGDVANGMRDSTGHYTGIAWLNMQLYPPDSNGVPGYLHWIAGKSTWRDRNGDGIFNIPVH